VDRLTVCTTIIGQPFLPLAASPASEVFERNFRSFVRKHFTVQRSDVDIQISDRQNVDKMTKLWAQIAVL
jgi:hypothetical protein